MIFNFTGLVYNHLEYFIKYCIVYDRFEFVDFEESAECVHQHLWKFQNENQLKSLLRFREPIVGLQSYESVTVREPETG